MRKFIAATFVAAALTFAVPATTHAQSQDEINWQVYNQLVTEATTQVGWPDPNTICASVNNQSYVLWGTMSWLSMMLAPGMADPSSQSTIYGPALAVAAGYYAGLAFNYWYWDCAHRIF